MPSRRISWFGVVGVLSLLAVVTLAWLAGYLYWQRRISRSIEEVTRYGKWMDDYWYRDAELYRIGSRGIPRLLRELDTTISRGDDKKGLLIACALADALNGAEDDDMDPSVLPTFAPPRTAQSLEDVNALFRSYENHWLAQRHHYPPWWMWWNGHRYRR